MTNPAIRNLEGKSFGRLTVLEKANIKIDNTVACCKTCNSMKSKLSVSDFKKQVERIYLSFVRDDK